MIERPDWTIAYRNPRANRFQRVTDLAVTWVDATAWALAISTVYPKLEVWYVPTAECENTWVADEPIHEDKGNILVPSGKRVRVFDTGSLAALGFERVSMGTDNAVTINRPFADEKGVATFRLPHHSAQQVDALFPGLRRIPAPVPNLPGNLTTADVLATRKATNHGKPAASFPSAERKAAALAALAEHKVYVNDRSGNDRWRALCSCGWKSRAFDNRNDPQAIADLHARTANHNAH